MSHPKIGTTDPAVGAVDPVSPDRAENETVSDRTRDKTVSDRIGDKTVSDQSGNRTAPHESGLGIIALIALALLAGVAPFATDLYLPAFPQMVTALSTTVSGVQLSLTAFLVGAGLGQLIFGPLSDRIGRRRPLVVGLVLYLIAGIVAATAPTIGVLIVARLAQGLTGSAGMVIGRAMIADVARGRQAARAMSTMMMVAGVAPVLAPILGGLFADAIGWRGLLSILIGLAVVSLAAALAFLPETHSPAARAELARKSSNAGWRTLLSRTYIGNTSAMVFSFATMMAYISASPFLYQNLMGLSTLQYSVAFAINALGIVSCTTISAKLVTRLSPRRLANIGMLINMTAIVAIVVIALTGLPIHLIAVALFFAIAPLGLVYGNTTAMALDAARSHAGLASAVLGALQFALAGLVSPLVGLGGETTAVPLALVMLAATIIARIGFQIAAPRSVEAAAGADQST